MEADKAARFEQPGHGLRQHPLASVVVVVIVGLAIGFALALPVLGLANHYDASDPVMLALFVALIAGVPTVMALLFVKKWGRRAVPVLQVVLAVIASMLAYLALAPIACDDSNPPQCTTFLGLESANDDVIEGIVGAVVAGAMTWLLVRLIMRRSRSR
jgi:xanthine/uracil permease